MNSSQITQKLVDAYTKAFNEALAGMTFQEVVNLALTGYLSVELKKSYQFKNSWPTEDAPAEAVEAPAKETEVISSLEVV